MKYTVKSNMTLLEALGQLSPDSSKTTLRSWLKEGRVVVDGTIAKQGTAAVSEGQQISLGNKCHYINDILRVHYEDNHLIVLEKPEGLLSVATDYENSATVHAMLKRHYRTQNIYVVHRLDQDTSGVMVFALSEVAYEYFKKSFEKHDIQRAYTAIVEGKMASSAGTWQSYLYEDGNYVVHSTSDSSRGRLAITHYELINQTNKYSLLNLTLKTGRKNQIRVHCRDAGHPIAGDQKYGSTNNPIKRLCLHAHLLAFMHPVTKKNMRFDSPPPERFNQLVRS